MEEGGNVIFGSGFMLGDLGELGVGHFSSNLLCKRAGWGGGFLSLAVVSGWIE